MKIKALRACTVISLYLPFMLLPAVSALNVFAQDASRASAKHLRAIFTRTYQADFELLSDEIVQRSAYHGAGRFWLARVRPKRAGFYIIRFRYQNTRDSLPLGENEFYINVGEKNCRRSYDEFPSFASLCLNDSVLVPINVDRYSRHEFVYAAPRPPHVFDDAYFDSRIERRVELDTAAVGDASFPAFKYLGRFHRQAPHRSADGSTAEFFAVTQAAGEGRYNLRISARAPANLNLPPVSAAALVFPVIVAARGKPVTVLAPHEKVHKFDEKRIYQVHDSEHYYVGARVAQPGDKLILKYASATTRDRTREWESVDWFGKIEPAIELEPFFLDRERSYNEWLLRYL